MTEFVVETADGACHYVNLDESQYALLPYGETKYKPSGFVTTFTLTNNSLSPVVGETLEIFINSNEENHTTSRNIGKVSAVYPCDSTPNLSVVEVSLVA